MKRYAIIVAGGKGERFGTGIPKQFLKLNGVPVLIHSIRLFENLVDQVILVLPEEHQEFWNSISKQHDLNVSCVETIGGASRSASVMNGLQMISDPSSLVAIHDAVRPLATKDMVRKLFDDAGEHGSAIPVIPSRDSIRRLNESGQSENVPREEYRIVQTPQVFETASIWKAYDQFNEGSFTDDASVYESAGFIPFLSEGESWNIKITNPQDLIIAESLIMKVL